MLARLHPDGSWDDSFRPSISDEVNSVLLQPDGKIVIGGTFERVNGMFAPGVTRLQSDGTLDSSFIHFFSLLRASALALSSGGKLVVATTDFQRLVLRLLPSGMPDPEFQQASFDGFIRAIAVQPDDRIVFGGTFNQVGSVTLRHLARLLPNGGVDASFVPNERITPIIHAIALQPDGQILIAGVGSPLSPLLRVNGDLPPLFYAAEFPSPGELLFRFRVVPGARYIVDRSGNLTDWVPVRTNWIFSNNGTISESIEMERSFFRVRQASP
jgi:uncharacterized delta-60 repeat protein